MTDFQIILVSIAILICIINLIIIPLLQNYIQNLYYTDMIASNGWRLFIVIAILGILNLLNII